MGDHAWDRMPCRVGGEDVRLAEVGVDLDLVDGRDDAALLQESFEVVRHEVADADGADLAVRQQLLQCLVCRDGEFELVRQGLVEDEQVELIEAELAGALVERVQGCVVAVVADPHLGLDEDLVPVQAGTADRLTDSRSLP